jgi:hypothetical protein
MQTSANEIHRRSGISIPTIRKTYKRVNPGASFDKYAELNGTGEALINALLKGRRTPKETKELRKLLSDDKQGQTTQVYVETSRAANARTRKQSSGEKGVDWRNVLAVLALPMLGLSASYGVFYFASHFAPAWVAGIEAMAFELTYIGLAMQTGLDEHQRKRANRISLFAMLVSVLYNVAAGFIHQVPGFVDHIGTLGKLSLSVLHGLPIPA